MGGAYFAIICIATEGVDPKIAWRVFVLGDLGNTKGLLGIMTLIDAFQNVLYFLAVLCRLTYSNPYQFVWDAWIYIFSSKATTDSFFVVWILELKLGMEYWD